MTHASYFRRPEQLLDELGLSAPEDIDIEAIAQYCGATVVYEHLQKCEARILGYGDRAVIAVNQASPRERQRFSIGHELGHWMNDRGRASFACDINSLRREWSTTNPEKLANRYAADLLLPVLMFQPLAKGRGITFETVRDLAERFETSLTATAIRLVEHGSWPAIVVCNGLWGRVWFVRGSSVPDIFFPTDKVGPKTVAFDLLRGDAGSGKPVEVPSSAWFEVEDAARYWIKEDSIRVGTDLVVSLLWWEDERQLLDFEDDESETDDSPRFR